MPIVLIYSRFSWDARVWKLFCKRFMNCCGGWSGFDQNFRNIFNNFIDFPSMFWKMLGNSSLSSLTIDPKNLFSRKTDYLAEEFSFQFLLFSWKISIQKSLFELFWRIFQCFEHWSANCFFFPFTSCWLLCFQQSIQFSPHFPREKVLIEKWNEISREADAEMIELKIVI